MIAFGCSYIYICVCVCVFARAGVRVGGVHNSISSIRILGVLCFHMEAWRDGVKHFSFQKSEMWSISILWTIALVKVFFNTPPYATVWSNAKPCWLRNIKTHCDLDTASYATCWDFFIWSVIEVVKIKMCLHIQYCKHGWSPAHTKKLTLKKKGVIAKLLFTPPNHVLY
jgi:hypothetical protein